MADTVPSSSGLTTKEILLDVLHSVKALDEKVDATRESQIKTETILTEGRFGERITRLEEFKNKTEGALSLSKWALGGSGVALILAILNLLDRSLK